MTTFHLSITLDPAAVHSGDDVQRALALTGAELANRYDGLTLPEFLTGTIRDNHGAPVGQWSTFEPDLTGDDGTVQAAVIRALMDRDSLAAASGAQWVENEPDVFWEEFAGPMLDDIERKFS